MVRRENGRNIPLQAWGAQICPHDIVCLRHGESLQSDSESRGLDGTENTRISFLD